MSTDQPPRAGTVTSALPHLVHEPALRHLISGTDVGIFGLALGALNGRKLLRVAARIVDLQCSPKERHGQSERIDDLHGRTACIADLRHRPCGTRAMRRAKRTRVTDAAALDSYPH